MKKSIWLPSATLLVGVLTFFLRKNQLKVAKDPETLLFIAGATETMLLMATIIGFMVVLAGILFAGGRQLPNYTYTVYCPSMFFVTTVATGSLLMILSVLVGFLDIKSEFDAFNKAISQGMNPEFEVPYLFLVTILLVAMVGMVMLFLGKTAYRGEQLKECWLTTVPAFLALARLVSTYRNNASSPNFQDSFYPVFGSMLLCLALYELSATAYLNPRPRLIVFFSLSSVVFTGAILASDVGVYEIVLYCGLNLYMLAFSAGILENTYTSREKYQTPPASGGAGIVEESN